MDFQFDPYKSTRNKKKHGIDFKEAQNLWKDPFRIEIPSKFVEEKRTLMIAMLNNVLWTAVITYRDHIIRIISVRKSRENEKKIYFSRRI